MNAKRTESREDTTGREFEITRVFDAPRELVWEAWADPAQVARWWGPRGFTTTTEKREFRPGGVWLHVMRGPDGTEYPNHSVFEEIVRPSRIVYSHGGEKKGGPSVRFRSTWTFDEVEGGKTRVTLHGVFPTAAEFERVVREFNAVEGGKQTLERFGEELEKIKAAGTTAEPRFIIVRTFDAPRERVWRAWTEPKQMARWWGPKIFTTPVCEMDVRPGGAYRVVMRGPDGVDYPLTGNFREIAAPERLVLTMDPTGHPAAWHDLVDPHRAAGENNPAGILLTTVTFEDLGGKTRLTVQTRFESARIGEAMLKMGMTEGWSESLDRLANLVAKG